MKIQQNFSLKDYNTFGVEAVADWFVSVDTVSELQSVLQDKQFADVPKFILGGGSNVLFTKPVKGLVIHLGLKGRKIGEKNGNNVTVEAAAGENWHDFVAWTLEQGFGGLENLSLIPGNVGTSPIQNIGAYGVEMRDVFLELEAVEIDTGEVRTFSKTDCQFGYRDSIFKNELKEKYVITLVRFELSQDTSPNVSYGVLQEKLKSMNIQNPTAKEVSQAVIDIRQSKLPDPVKIGNGGSFFKNPVLKKADFLQLQEQYLDMPHYPADNDLTKVPAGWLIETAGWKGKQVGDAGVHKDQALVLVNYGEATGLEIWELAQKIQSSVREKFGIELTPEINIW